MKYNSKNGVTGKSIHRKRKTNSSSMNRSMRRLLERESRSQRNSSEYVPDFSQLPKECFKVVTLDELIELIKEDKVKLL
jgi:hypothetical protein